MNMADVAFGGTEEENAEMKKLYAEVVGLRCAPMHYPVIVLTLHVIPAGGFR